jgi:maltose alpha-D-glucosyltransferase / alpha-amylase
MVFRPCRAGESATHPRTLYSWPSRNSTRRPARSAPAGPDEVATTEELRPRERWGEVFEGRRRARLEDRLVEFLRRQRWFAGKGRELKGGRIENVVIVPLDADRARIVLLRVDYVGDDPERYLVPLSFSTGEAAERIREAHPEMVVCRVSIASDTGILHDALADPRFSGALLDMVARRRELDGEKDGLAGSTHHSRKGLFGEEPEALAPTLGRAEQSNSSIRFGDRWILKLFRRLELGVNQDLEIGEFLREAGFPYSPQLAGFLEFRREERPLATVGVLHEFVPNQGDAWEHTLDSLVQYFEAALASDLEPGDLPQVADLLRVATARQAASEGPPEEVGTLVGPYLGSARNLGWTTGELHRTLASRPDLAAFRPEPFGTLYQRSLYQSTRNLLGSSLDRLERRVRHLGEEERELAGRVLQAGRRRFVRLTGG